MKRKIHDQKVAILEAEIKAVTTTNQAQDALIDKLYRRLKKRKDMLAQWQEKYDKLFRDYMSIQSQQQQPLSPQFHSIDIYRQKMSEMSLPKMDCEAEFKKHYPEATMEDAGHKWILRWTGNEVSYLKNFYSTIRTAWYDAWSNYIVGLNKSGGNESVCVHSDSDSKQEKDTASEPSSEHEKQSYKDRVLAMYPEAVVDITYAIYTDPENSSVYGVGGDEQEAWKDCYEQHVKPLEGAKAQVLEIYPEASCEESETHFIVRPKKDMGFIGFVSKSEGEREADAWLDALNHIKNNAESYVKKHRPNATCSYDSGIWAIRFEPPTVGYGYDASSEISESDAWFQSLHYVKVDLF
jgi:hypothetical protein